MVIIMKTKRPHMCLEHRRRRHGVGKGAVRVGYPVDVEAARTGDVRFLEFIVRPPVRGRQMIADIEDPDVVMV